MTKAEVEQNEQTLVKLYMDLTGAAETNARSVLMYVQPADEPAAEEVSSAGPKAN